MAGAAPAAGEALALLDVNAVRRWAVLVRSVLGARRTEIDALNVFPVPDGDTGTNLFLTVDGAIDRMLDDEPAPGAGFALHRFAGHLLWTARGNSGVILSQLAHGLGEACRSATTIDGPTLAAGLVQADSRAWRAVTEPKEGTILSVSRAMAEAAQEAASDPDVGLHAVSAAALAAAEEALARTPEQLEVLARAGVVDVGGVGLVLVLECLERLCAGDDGRAALGLGSHGHRVRVPERVLRPALDVTRPLEEGGVDLGEDAPEYEVMYLLADATEASVEVLRNRLVELGDSVLVVGGEGAWNVHAHVDDAGAAVEAGIEAGRPHRIRITRLTGPHEPRVLAAEPETGVATGVVACTVGDGLVGLFSDAGAVVVPSRPGHRASTGTIIEAVRSLAHRVHGGVVVLPNDADTELAAAAAVRAVADDGVDAYVVRARTAVQGLAALAVFDAGAQVTDNVLRMQAAASATRHGALAVADRHALTSGGACRPGDVLGIVDGDVVIVGEDQAAVGGEVVRRLMSSGGELLTVVRGADAPPGLSEAVVAAARAERRDIEVSQVEGGQPVYTVLLGVE